jgi:RHS repeat-associated protein
MLLPNRHEATSEYRYGFNGMEKDDEVKGSGNSYDFGARIYDSRVGRWLSLDPLEKKYPSLTPYNYVANTPIIAIDPDGKDIIVLSAPSGARGFGHAAVLIGNDKDGWLLYSKNGTAEHGKSGASANPDNGRKFNSLTDFANSEANFHNGNVYYTSAYRITTSVSVDNDMKTKAKEVVQTDYDLYNASCIDLCSDVLEAGGLDPGHYETPPSYYGVEVENIDGLADEPNIRYDDIVNNNAGVDVTNEIKPDSEVVKLRKDAQETKEVNLNANSKMDNAPEIWVTVPTKKAIKTIISNPQLFDGIDNNDKVSKPIKTNN